MQGAISSISALERWFRINESPFFNLAYYSTQSPSGQGQVIAKNTREGDLDASWAKLKALVEDQTGFGRAQLNLIVYQKAENANNPVGRTNIDIVAMPSSSNSSVVGIGSIPSGYVSKDEIQDAIDKAREKWDMEARIHALENHPSEDWMEKLERISALPTVQMFISAFMAKNGMVIPQPIAGLAQDDSALPDDGGDFDADIERTTQILGVSENVLAARIRQFAEQQPEVARQLFNQ